MLHLLADVDLPETYHFLGLGWFIIHLIAIPGFFFAGYMLARTRQKKA